jgi:hypothetical protein
MITFDPYRLLRLLLPTFCRQPLRIARLEAWLATFLQRWSEYERWRHDTACDARVTAQVISIEACLNRLFDAEQRRITVGDAYFDNRVYVALREEEYDDFYIDGQAGTFIPLDAEQAGDGFEVRLPADLEDVQGQVDGVVNKIRALGMAYRIVII